MNVKVFSTVALIILLTASTSQAADIPMGCMPKEKLQALFKEKHQSFLEQFMRQTPKGDIKTSVTSEHDGVGYVHRGYGYIVESHDNEACVISKTRLDTGPGKNQVTVTTVQDFAGQTFTSDEWVKIADTVLSDTERFSKEWEADGIDEERREKWFEGYRILKRNKGLPGGINVKFVYELEPDKVIPVNKTPF